MVIDIIILLIEVLIWIEVKIPSKYYGLIDEEDAVSQNGSERQNLVRRKLIVCVMEFIKIKIISFITLVIILFKIFTTATYTSERPNLFDELVYDELVYDEVIILVNGYLRNPTLIATPEENNIRIWYYTVLGRIQLKDRQKVRESGRELISLIDKARISIDNLVRSGVSKTLEKEEREQECVKDMTHSLYDVLWNILYSMVYYLIYYVFIELVKIRNYYDNIMVNIDDMYGRERDDNTAGFIDMRVSDCRMYVLIIGMIILCLGGAVIRFDIVGIILNGSGTPRLLLADGIELIERRMLERSSLYGAIIKNELRDKDRNGNSVIFMRELNILSI